MSNPSGALLLLPTLLGESPPERVLPAETLTLARATTVFLAENAKSARAFLKLIAHPQPLASLAVTEIGHHPDPRRFDEWLRPAIEGRDVALLSEELRPEFHAPVYFPCRFLHGLLRLFLRRIKHFQVNESAGICQRKRQCKR